MKIDRTFLFCLYITQLQLIEFRQPDVPCKNNSVKVILDWCKETE